jgi:phospholipase/carboxylesterase
MPPFQALSAPTVESFTTVYLRATEPSPRLMVVLHGLGDSLEGFRWLPGGIALSRYNYLLVNAPLEYYEGFSWYDPDLDPRQDLERGRAKLTRLFAELEAQGWASPDILLFGFSQGCVMAADFGLRWEKPLAGIVGISGYIFFSDTVEEEIHPQARQQSWLITHGSYDSLLPVDRTREQVRRLKKLGLRVDWMEVRKDHSIDMGEELAAIRGWIVEHAY